MCRPGSSRCSRLRGGVGFLLLLPEHHVLGLRGLLLRKLQETLGPHVLRREQGEPRDDQQPARDDRQEETGESGEHEQSPGDRDGHSLPAPTDEPAHDLERDERGMVLPAPYEVRSGGLELLNDLAGVDLFRLVAPGSVTEPEPSRRSVFRLRRHPVSLAWARLSRQGAHRSVRNLSLLPRLRWMGYNIGASADFPRSSGRGSSMSVWVSGQSGLVRSSEPDPRQFRLFAFCVVLVAIVMLALAALLGRTDPLPLLDLVAWIVLVALVGVLPVGSGSGPRLAMDLPLLLAAAFSFDPFAAGLIALVGSVDIRELRREISLTRALWNRSQTAISVMTASLVFAGLGGLHQWPATAFYALVALIADGTVNYLTVAIGTSLRTGIGLVDALANMKFGSSRTFILTYVCFGFLGVLIAEAHSAFGLAGGVGELSAVVFGCP